jgi:hypothetical protein
MLDYSEGAQSKKTITRSLIGRENKFCSCLLKNFSFYAHHNICQNWLLIKCYKKMGLDIINTFLYYLYSANSFVEFFLRPVLANQALRGTAFENTDHTWG